MFVEIRIMSSYQVKEPISLDLVSANASAQATHPRNQIWQDPKSEVELIERDTPSSEKKTDLSLPPGGNATVSPS